MLEVAAEFDERLKEGRLIFFSLTCNGDDDETNNGCRQRGVEHRRASYRD
jgi:hypothetical protein